MKFYYPEINSCKWVFLIISLAAGMLSPNTAFSDERLIRLGIVEKEYPPYKVFKDGAMSGIVGDTFLAVSKIINYKIDITVLPRKRLHRQIKAGNIDALASALEWEKEEKQLTWTEGIIQVSDNVVMRKDKAKNILSSADLKGKQVALMEGYTYPSLEESIKNGMVLANRVSKLQNLLRMVDGKRVDYGVLDQNVARWVMLGLTPNLAERLYFSSPGFDEVEYRVILYPTKDWTSFIQEFNKALAKFKTTKAWGDILNKYR